MKCRLKFHLILSIQSFNDVQPYNYEWNFQLDSIKYQYIIYVSLNSTPGPPDIIDLFVFKNDHKSKGLFGVNLHSFITGNDDQNHYLHCL